MRIVLSFDDGRTDTFSNAFPILKKYNLTASVHITTGFIDGSFETDEFGVGMKPLTILELNQMKEYGIDISSHGDRHMMESNDYFASKNKIEKWIGINKIGFSVPNSSAEKAEIDKFLMATKFDPLYIRVGRDKKSRSFINKVRYVFYKMFHFQSAFNSFNKCNLISDVDRYYIKSCVVKKHTKAKNIIQFIKKYQNNEYLLVLMLHSISVKPSNQWEWELNQFDELCNELCKMQNAGLITISNLAEIAKEEQK